TCRAPALVRLTDQGRARDLGIGRSSRSIEVCMFIRIVSQVAVAFGLLVCFLGLGPNRTNTIVAGNDPFAVAVNRQTNKIYVANFGDSSVTVIDGASGSTREIPVGLHPAAVAINETSNRIYVANSSENTVTIID